MSKPIYLVEEFYSIQGEGLFSGVPSIFLRFGGCNLTCRGFKTEYKNLNGDIKVGCDSYYAVDRGFKSEWRELKEFKDIEKILDKYPTAKHIVLTGGEPLIYIKNSLFLESLESFKKMNYTVTIETNGTIPITDREIFKDILFSISPKLSNSNEPLKSRFNLDTLNSIINNSNHHIFKFTIDRESIVEGVESEIQEIKKEFPDIQIFLMPIGNSREELTMNSESVANLSLKGGYSYSDRLHIRIWNDKKGV